MKNIFNIIIFSLILWVGSSKISFAATGPADNGIQRGADTAAASIATTAVQGAQAALFKAWYVALIQVAAPDDTDST